METIRDLFANNMIAVFFVYGLSWFVMGLAVALETKKDLGLRLAGSLPWLAAFGITHGLVEWSDMLKLAYGLDSPQSSNELFLTGKTILLGISVAFLLQFGAHLLANTNPKLRWLKALPPMLFVVWIVSPFFVIQVAYTGGWEVAASSTCLNCHSSMPAAITTQTAGLGAMWRLVADILARYLLYTPGLLLSAVALWQQAPDFEAANLKRAALAVKSAAIVFVIGAFFFGLVVAPGPFFPADVLNYHTFEGLVGIPPQVFRAATAMVSAILIVPLMRVFEAEHRRQLETSRKQLAEINEELEKRVLERTQKLEALVESAKTLSSTLDIDPLLNGVMKEVVSLVGPAELGLLFVWDEDSERLIGRSAFGCNEEVISELHLESGEMIAGRVFREQRAWVSNDPLQITRAMGSLQPENYHLLETAGVNIANIQNVICVPLIAKGRGVGALFLTNVQDAPEFPIDLLGALADQIALTLENSHLYEETKRLSATDPLTGLWNRRTIERRLRTEIRRHERGEREFSLLIVDVDRLKLFNDTHGHAVGDQVILTVASVLQNTCRETDDVGRHGGDEFTVIMPDSGAEEALILAKRIIENLDAKPFHPPEGDPVPVSVSIGGATYPADAQDADGLFMLADASMYRVKLRGGAEYSSQANPLISLTTAPQPIIDAVRGLVATVDAKDNYTFRHSRTVTDHALQLAEVMGLTERDKQTLLLAGQLHDVGKIGIPTEVLRKPGRLTEEEYAIVREHPRLGHTILHQLPKIPDVLDAVLYHHERWDGSGYPDGLKEEEIPVLARILALADAYSAMTSTRPYRKALTSSAALQEIKKYANLQFDPKLAQMFVALKLSDPDPVKTDPEDDADPDLPPPLSQSE